MNFKDKKVCVIGTGISGIGAANLLTSLGADVCLYDGNENIDTDKIKEKLENKNIRIITGKIDLNTMNSFELSVLSPGVPVDIPIVQEMEMHGIKIWGEIELAYNCGKGEIAAITGTNGKTTTTALTGAIMSNYFKSVFVVGNIGTPYTSVVNKMNDETVTVAEISSFQLETIDNFRPKVSAILNITPDHLNRHKTMENYIAVKESITKNQMSKDTCVLNYEDEILRQFGEKLNLNVLFFSSLNKLSKGVYIDGKNIVYNSGKAIDIICSTDELKLLGTHNYENAMAAAAISISMGVPLKVIRDTLIRFEAVEHRIEFVANKKGVAYYNDSKGTNPDAAIKGIQAMKAPTLLIGGGYDKDSEYDEWIEAFDGKVKWLVLIGQTKEKIADCARRLGFNNILFADSLEEAIDICSERAECGDAVLLSPACASWGMFTNYEERGKCFKDYVNSL